MKNKRPMMLTIIGVVTLLVAVVGATFAYFSVTATDNTTSSNLNVTIESLGLVELTTTTGEMHITTTASDFAESNTGTYWATKTANTNHVASEETNAIHTLKVTGGSNTAVYECTYDLTVSTTGLPASGMAASGEYIVYLKGTNGTVAYTLDMVTVSNRNKAYTVKTYLTGAGATKTIRASAKLINTSSEQNYLRGLTIQTTFNVTSNNLNCILVAQAGSDSITENATPTPTSQTYYWTKEPGQDEVYYESATKYTEAQKSQIPNDYYMKTTIASTIAEEETWAIYVSGELHVEYGIFSNQSACESFIDGAPDTITCGEITGQTYDMVENEVCVKFNSEVCFSQSALPTEIEFTSKMAEAGATSCTSFGTTYYCSNESMENGMDDDVQYLYCEATSRRFVYCGTSFGGVASICGLLDNGVKSCYSR